MSNVVETSVDGHPATLMNLTWDIDAGHPEGFFNGALGCPTAGADQAEGCFGPQPDLMLRLGVIDVGCTTLLAWARMNRDNPDPVVRCHVRTNAHNRQIPLVWGTRIRQKLTPDPRAAEATQLGGVGLWQVPQQEHVAQTGRSNTSLTAVARASRPHPRSRGGASGPSAGRGPGRAPPHTGPPRAPTRRECPTGHPSGAFPV